VNAVNNNQRRTEVDLIRGIALLFIVVDHVNGSVLADYTIRNFHALRRRRGVRFPGRLFGRRRLSGDGSPRRRQRRAQTPAPP
jgi:uncharacterized membrane protein